MGGHLFARKKGRKKNKARKGGGRSRGGTRLKVTFLPLSNLQVVRAEGTAEKRGKLIF